MKWGKTRSIEKDKDKNKNNSNTLILINNKLDQKSYIDEEDIEKGKVDEEIDEKVVEEIEKKIEEYNDEEDIEKGKVEEEDNYEEGGFIQEHEQERETDV